VTVLCNTDNDLVVAGLVCQQAKTLSPSELICHESSNLLPQLKAEKTGLIAFRKSQAAQLRSPVLTAIGLVNGNPSFLTTDSRKGVFLALVDIAAHLGDQIAPQKKQFLWRE